MAGMMARVLMNSSAGLYPSMGKTNGTGRKKRKVKAARRRKVAKRRKPANKRARLVKGSAAAKAYMAKIRKKRRR